MKIYQQRAIRPSRSFHVAVDLFHRRFCNTRLVQVTAASSDMSAFPVLMASNYSGMRSKQPQEVSSDACRGLPLDMLLLLQHANNDMAESLELLSKMLGNLTTESEERGLCMDKWAEEAASEGSTPLHDYYRQLEGYVWTVWRVRNPQIEGKHLRIMAGVPGDRQLRLAYHFQEVVDGRSSTRNHNYAVWLISVEQ